MKLSGFMYAFRSRERAVEVLREAEARDPFAAWNSKLDTAHPGKMLEKDLRPVVVEITADLASTPAQLIEYSN